MSSRSKYEFYKEASLSQQLADKYPEYVNYAGSNPEISLSLALFKVLGDHGIIDTKDPTIKLMIDLLNEQRKASFATSERTNEVTKMGLQMPKAELEFYGDKEEDDKKTKS